MYSPSTHRLHLTNEMDGIGQSKSANKRTKRRHCSLVHMRSSLHALSSFGKTGAPITPSSRLQSPARSEKRTAGQLGLPSGCFAAGRLFCLFSSLWSLTIEHSSWTPDVGFRHTTKIFLFMDCLACTSRCGFSVTARLGARFKAAPDSYCRCSNKLAADALA